MKAAFSYGRQYGSVKWYNTKKGFGFIRPSDGSEDLFVHFSKIKDNNDGSVILLSGQQVEYTIGQNRRGLQAENVTLREPFKNPNRNSRTSHKKINPLNKVFRQTIIEKKPRKTTRSGFNLDFV